MLSLGACATTGATLGSGVGDTFPRRPPWMAGGTPAAAGAHPAYHPVRLDSLAATGVSRRLVEGGRNLPELARVEDGGPDLRFGCVRDPRSSLGECAVSGDTVLGRDTWAMELTVGRPSRPWVEWVAGEMRAQDVDAVLVLTLEPAQYLPRQAGLRGDKYVELGAGHRVALPWLTSLETPVTVLQLTGALVRPDGRAVRIGAEGILVRRTSLPASGLGLRRILTAADLEAALAHRRDDLPGAPPAWAVALDQLVLGLTGAPR